jgi:hypothetical protein
MFKPKRSAKIFGDDLLANEEILWSGQPDPTKLLTAADIFLIPFSLVWTGVTVSWEGVVLFAITKRDPASSLWGLVLVVTSLYLT